MTEIKESTIRKLTNLSWRRKLNELNSSQRGVNRETDQFWKPDAKPNSDSQSPLSEYEKDCDIHQTPFFETKNEFTPAKQNNDVRHFNAAKETSIDQRYERQPKNKNDRGLTYRKDKENRSNSGHQINSQNQKYFKRDDRNQNVRGNQTKSPNHNLNEDENNIEKDQRFSHQQQSRNYNQNNRGYHRIQERSDHQNYNRNDAKNRRNYLKSGRFIQLNSYSENSTSNVENSSNHYQNFFSANESPDLFSDQFTAGVSEPVPTNIQTNDTFQTSIQLNQSSNIPVETAHFINNNYVSSSQIAAADVMGRSLVNDNGSYLDQIAAVRPPNRSLVNGDFNNFAYSNQITAGSCFSQSTVNDYFTDGSLGSNEVTQFGNQFTSNSVIPTTFSSLSPHVADFIPRQNRIQNSNQVEFFSPVNLQQDSNLENTYAFSSSTPNNNQYQNAIWPSQSDISNCNETVNLGSTSFQNGVEMLPTFCQNESSEGLHGIFNQQQTAIPDTPSDGQLFNFNGRMVNLSNKDNQPVVNEHPPAYDIAQNVCTHQNNSIDGQFNYDINVNSGADNYSKNLSFNNQQITNILQIASLNLDQESSPVPPSSCQRINDMFQMSNVDANMNENIVRRTNASILSQAVVNNASNLSPCEVRRNSRVNVLQDYYRKPTADNANNLKCTNESEELNSKLEIVAQQLFNVNKYVSSAEMNAGTLKDQHFGMGSRCYDGNLNNNSGLQTKFVANMKTSEADLRNNFQQNYVCGRNSFPMNSADRNNCANTSLETGRSPFNHQTSFETGRSPLNHQTSFKNEFTRNNNRRLFNNQIRIMNDKPTYATVINMTDDSFVNFNRSARQKDSGNLRLDITLGKAPSVGILKKSTKSVLDSAIQFQKSLTNEQITGDSCSSSKENSPSNKRVSFLFENRQ